MKAPSPNRKREIQDGGGLTGSTCISASVQDRKEIPTKKYFSMMPESMEYIVEYCNITVYFGIIGLPDAAEDAVKDAFW